MLVVSVPLAGWVNESIVGLESTSMSFVARLDAAMEIAWSSLVATASSLATGSSLTGVTVMVTVAVLDAAPSVTV